MICEPYEVIVVPFPFSERVGAKRRPALVLSKRSFNENGHVILAMITTKGHSPWLGDTELKDLKECGLPVPCLVRLKLFTLDNRLIIRRIGRLSEADRKRVGEHFHQAVA